METIRRDWSIRDYATALALSKELLDSYVEETAPDTDPLWLWAGSEPLAALLWLASRSPDRGIAWLMKLDSRLFGDYQQLVDSDTWFLATQELEGAGLLHPAECLRKLAIRDEALRESVFKTMFAAAEPLLYLEDVTLCAKRSQQ